MMERTGKNLRLFTTGRIHSSSFLLYFIQVSGLSEGKYGFSFSSNFPDR